jgi:hypothetical protein
MQTEPVNAVIERRALAKAAGLASRLSDDVRLLVAQTSILSLTIARQGVAVAEELDLLRFHLREATLRAAIGEPGALIETKPLPPQDSPQAPAKRASKAKANGGHARAAALSPKRRRAIAKAAAAARWGKRSKERELR